MARRSAGHGRTDGINQMRALPFTGPDELRETLRGTTVWRMVTAAARLRPNDPTSAAGATEFALRELARRIQTLEAEIDRLDAILHPLVGSRQVPARSDPSPTKGDAPALFPARPPGRPTDMRTPKPRLAVATTMALVARVTAATPALAAAHPR